MHWLVYQTVIEKRVFNSAKMSNDITISTFVRKVEADSEAEAIGKFMVDTEDAKVEQRIDPITCFEFDKLKTIN